MPTPVWPSADGFPQKFLQDGFNHTLPDYAHSSQIPGFAPIRRRRTLANVATMSGRMRMTHAQWSVLEDFYKNTVKGVLDFTLPDPFIEGETLTVCFSSPPSRAPRTPDTVLVTLSLEVKP